METVTIDKDVYEFLKAIYFGSFDNAYVASANRAYLDMNRTIRYNGMDNEKRDELKLQVFALLEKEIKQLCASDIDSQSTYDEWHFRVCDEIRTIYRKEDIGFCYGQSQKWLNMTMKYLYIIGECNFSGIFQYLHAPLDNYIFRIAQKEFGIKKPKVAWSRFDDYKIQYMSYQKELREKSKATSPNLLRWEFENWLKEARNK